MQVHRQGGAKKNWIEFLPEINHSFPQGPRRAASREVIARKTVGLCLQIRFHPLAILANRLSSLSPRFLGCSLCQEWFVAHVS